MNGNTKPAPIRVQWETGHYELNPEALCTMKPAQLKKLLKQGTVNAAETVEAVRACIEASRKKQLTRSAHLLPNASAPSWPRWSPQRKGPLPPASRRGS